MPHALCHWARLHLQASSNYTGRESCNKAFDFLVGKMKRWIKFENVNNFLPDLEKAPVMMKFLNISLRC